ncbi:hypothetical protein C2G38_2116816 [Gigaspora rosea]|uniref:Uncharacterized protein n=1 Tax=Gigaspora rosea TaxID=44941 RepID=A0A397UAP8_9GLOM|nr:hypothetical protein C2G38_2116816 [Gigaspora rosea]
MISKRGHSIVFSALWSDGIRITKYKNGNYVGLRKQSSIVALKTLSSDKKIVLSNLKII